MNRADFNTQPDGFPLESDATLGFMQSSYLDAINALAKLADFGNVILTGLVKTGNNYSDGWILYNNELLFFQGGPGSAKFIIEQTVTQKQNQNGNLVDRYFVRKARFGSGSGEVLFSSLSRVSPMIDQQENDWALGHGGLNSLGSSINDSDWVVLAGLRKVGSTITAGRVIYRNRVLNPSTFSDYTVDENNPVWLTPDGEWSDTTGSDYLKLDPDTAARTQYLAKTRHAAQGEVRWIDTSIDDPTNTHFSATGLGKWAWEGWAIANGNNGTTDRTALLTGLLPVVKL